MKHENNFENASGGVLGICGGVGSVCSLFHLLNKQNQIVSRGTFWAKSKNKSLLINLKCYEIRK